MPQKIKDDIQIQVESEMESIKSDQDVRYDAIALQATKQLDVGAKVKQPRVEDWIKSEDMYNNKKEPSLPGRFNVPLPIIPGYVDTLHAKIDDDPTLEYSILGKADYRRARKITAAWEVDKASNRGNWAEVDRACKKSAIFTGVGIYKIYAESSPEYEHHFEQIDPYDFVCDATRGNDLEKHQFAFQDNIFRSQYDLQEGVDGGIYNAEQVKRLKTATGEESQDRYTPTYRNKVNKLHSLGLDVDKDFSGDTMYRLTEGFTTYKGIRYYILFEADTNIWIRIEKLDEVFNSRGYQKKGKVKLPYVAWHTNPDPFNFWSKAPVDDIRPIAVVMKVVVNQALYNLNKRNSGQRAYDPTIFKDPAMLDFRPDGIVPAYATDAGKNISDGIYEFKTEDNTAITIHLTQFLDNMLGQKSGITASAQGATDNDQRVGIYYGDLQQVADRLGLLNKSYASAWEKLGYRYVRDLWENFSSKMMIQWFGEDGLEFDELRKEDFDPDMIVIVKGGSAEAQANELEQKRKSDTLIAISADPLLSPLLNAKWKLQEYMRAGGYDEQTIRDAMDLATFGSREEKSAVSQAIQDILEGKAPRKYYGATTAYMQKLVNYALDNREALGRTVVTQMLAFAAEHTQIAKENMQRLALFSSITLGAEGAGNAPANSPTPTTQGRSQDTSEGLTPPQPSSDLGVRQ